MKFHYGPEQSVEIPDEDIPARANWIGAGSMGSVYWFENRPKPGKVMWISVVGPWGYLMVDMPAEVPNWQTTLVKLDREEGAQKLVVEEEYNFATPPEPVADTPPHKRTISDHDGTITLVEFNPEKPTWSGIDWAHGYTPAPKSELPENFGMVSGDVAIELEEANKIIASDSVTLHEMAAELEQAQAKIQELEEELREEKSLAADANFHFMQWWRTSRRYDWVRRIAEHYRAKYLGLKAGGRIHRAWQREAREPEPVLTFPRYKDAAGRES